MTKIFTNRKKIFALGMAGLLAMSLAGCYEYRGSYTKADVEEYLTGRYPDKTINIRQKGLQTWECRFDELPDAVFQVWVGQSGGDPVPMLYSRLVSDEAGVILAYYMEQFQKEGGSFQETVAHGSQDRPEAVQEAPEDSVKKYYAFYCLPCDEFSQTELEEYAVKTWPWNLCRYGKQG